MAEVIITLSAVCIAAITAVYHHRREKRLLQKLQQMIDCAANGRYETEHVDESMLSLVENSLHRFLKSSQVSAENLQAQQERIQTLISDISHQTVTPISNIMLYTQLLEEKAAGLGFAEEIDAVKEQTEKLSFLIESLVKTARLENGIIAVRPQENPLLELIHAAVEQIKAKARDKGIAIAVDSTQERAIFDKKWTVEALYNILDNAVKYTKPGGWVRIETIAYDLFVRLNVTDNGIGIDESEHSKIFRRFYRSQQAAEEDGVGIGLYLAREILSAEGGYIKLTSEPGKGAQFSIFLPQAQNLSKP